MTAGGVLHPNDDGVVNLPQPHFANCTVSSVLTLSVENKNGDKWPKNVTCQVKLEPENGLNVSKTYIETQEVTVTSKSLVESVIGP